MHWNIIEEAKTGELEAIYDIKLTQKNFSVTSGHVNMSFLGIIFMYKSESNGARPSTSQGAVFPPSCLHTSRLPLHRCSLFSRVLRIQF